MEDIIRRYFNAWVKADGTVIKEIFSDKTVYSECYGPEYHGLDQIVKWFEAWNQKGRVLEWNIKRMDSIGKTVYAEWYFKCEYEGNIDGFDGVTIADFDDDGRIVKLCEFQSKAEHYLPYGE